MYQVSVPVQLNFINSEISFVNKKQYKILKINKNIISRDNTTELIFLEHLLLIHSHVIRTQMRR